MLPTTIAAQVIRRCVTMENLICTVHRLLLIPAEVYRTKAGVYVEYVLYDGSVVVVHKGAYYEKSDLNQDYGASDDRFKLSLEHRVKNRAKYRRRVERKKAA